MFGNLPPLHVLSGGCSKSALVLYLLHLLLKFSTALFDCVCTAGARVQTLIERFHALRQLCHGFHEAFKLTVHLRQALAVTTANSILIKSCLELLLEHGEPPAISLSTVLQLGNSGTQPLGKRPNLLVHSDTRHAKQRLR